VKYYGNLNSTLFHFNTFQNVDYSCAGKAEFSGAITPVVLVNIFVGTMMIFFRFL